MRVTEGTILNRSEATMLTDGELELIGYAVDGHFYRYEDDGQTLVFCSLGFPSHRITVKLEAAERWIEERFAAITANAQAD